MNCDACDHLIDFGAVKIFGGRTVCDACFAVLTSKVATADIDSSLAKSTAFILMTCEDCGRSFSSPVGVRTTRVTCSECVAVVESLNLADTRQAAVTDQLQFTAPSSNPPHLPSDQLNNGYGTASFALGIASVLLYQIGIIPLLGIVFGVIALSTYKEAIHKNKWMAITGLVLSMIYMIMSASFWAQSEASPSQVLQGKPTQRHRGR